MFIWVNQGIVEPYIPRVRAEGIRRVTSLHSGIPEKPIDTEHTEEKDSGERYLAEKVAEAYGSEEFQLEEKKRIYYARDIMSTRLVTIGEFESLQKVEVLFRDNKFRHLPVLQNDKTLYGIVSERDMFRFFLEQYRQAHRTSDATVKDVVKKRTLTAYPTTPIRDIAGTMFEEKVGSIPILNKETLELLGIVTRSDILKAVMNHNILEIYS